MNSTQQNVLRKGLGASEYAKLLDSANQISIFGEPVKQLSKEELLAALVFTMQSNQNQPEEQSKASALRNLSVNTQTAGLW
jgi:hypothetical protein